MRHYGIIGFPLLHSFSAKYFSEKFRREKIDAEYSLYPISAEETQRIGDYVNRLDGMNVTMPYKQTVIAFLDRLDDTAKAVGAVNVVYKRVGYNTDCLGFMDSLRPLLRDFDKKALVLGTGGASKAACYGLKTLGLQPTLVSRTPKTGVIGYKDLTEEIMLSHTVIVNCTPLGMLPDVDSCPDIPYELISARHLLFDCVYNPEETLFLKSARKKNWRTASGLDMFAGQAQLQYQLFLNQPAPADVMKDVVRKATAEARW